MPAAEPGAGLRLRAGEASPRARVEDLLARRLDVVPHLLERAHERRAQPRLEGPGPGRAMGALHGATLRAPQGQPAVEHRDAVVAHGAEGPPHARGADHAARVVHDDQVARADAESAYLLGELRRRGQHVRQRRALVRDRVDVEEARAREMPSGELLARVALELGHVPAPVEDDQARVAEVGHEPLGADDGAGCARRGGGLGPLTATAGAVGFPRKGGRSALGALRLGLGRRAPRSGRGRLGAAGGRSAALGGTAAGGSAHECPLCCRNFVLSECDPRNDRRQPLPAQGIRGAALP
jgi:hypothetical protein